MDDDEWLIVVATSADRACGCALWDYVYVYRLREECK
jgi:hypothetical protein